jgi:signal transduction histidine kinase
MIKKYNILLVEDNTADARMFSERLKELQIINIQFSWVQTLAQAINEISKTRFDVVFLDLNLPDSNGGATISKMYSHAPDIAIIVLTGIEDEQAEKDAIKLGAQDYLVKGEIAEKLLLRVIRYAVDRKRISRELQETSQKLDQYILNLKATMKELESFTYSVSHDLRAPLRTIINLSQMLLEVINEGNYKESENCTNRIIHSAKQMNSLIDDMLYLSKVNSCEMNRRTINLSSEISEILNELLKNEPERTIEFRITPDIYASADPKLIRIALVNICNNAWKFTKYVKSPVIEFGELKSDKGKFFFIKDNGAGFDEQNAEKLFLPFQRLHSEREFSGTGVGLAIVERVIRRHGGTIWAKGKVGQGATFNFTLGE